MLLLAHDRISGKAKHMPTSKTPLVILQHIIQIDPTRFRLFAMVGPFVTLFVEGT
jgi:hypothetical protein